MHKAAMFISEQLRHELQQRSYLIQASLPVLAGWPAGWLARWLAAGWLRAALALAPLNPSLTPPRPTYLTPAPALLLLLL
jgi:hypothetical protein